jgi:hypothetical protein
MLSSDRHCQNRSSGIATGLSFFAAVGLGSLVVGFWIVRDLP